MYSVNCRIRYSETDRSGRLSMNGLLRLFQDIGYSHAADRKFGPEFTRRTRCTWYLLSWQIHVLNKSMLPVANEQVTISTWYYECQASLLYKSIELKGADGKTLAVGDTKWVYMNIDRQVPSDAPTELLDREDFAERLQMPDTCRRIAIPNNLKITDKKYISPYLIDTNGHANNVKLTELAMNVSGADAGCSALRAEFKKQVKGDTNVYPYIAERENRTVTVFKNEENEVLSVFEFIR